MRTPRIRSGAEPKLLPAFSPLPMTTKVTIEKLQQMKHSGEKIVGIVVWDCHMAAIADRAGADIVSVGDSVGVNLWGHRDPLAVTLEQMITVAQAARAGTERALLSCDFPVGLLESAPETAPASVERLVTETGVDVIKLDGATERPELVATVTHTGIPVWAEFAVTDELVRRHGLSLTAFFDPATEIPSELIAELVAVARSLEAAGAAMLDFKNSGPVAGAAVAEAVEIPVIGGLGGGPWLDGRVRMAHAAIGYSAHHIDEAIDTYANVARTALDALQALTADIRAARQIKGS